MFTKTAEGQRKMKTGVDSTQEALHQEFLAYFLSVSYAHLSRLHLGKTEVQEKNKRKPTRPCGV